MPLKYLVFTLLAIAAAIGLIKLGALSVLVAVLSLAVRVMAVLIAAGALGALALHIWTRFKR